MKRPSQLFRLLLVLVSGTSAISGLAASYYSEVAADNPLGWWRLTDAPPPTNYPALDSGSGHNSGLYSTLINQTSGIPGTVDMAAEFQGGYIDVDNPLQFDSGGGALTVEAWVRPGGTGNFQWMVAKDDNNTGLDYLLGINPDGTFRFITQGLANDVQDSNGPSAFDGSTWYHVVGVQDPTDAVVVLYVNGQLVGSKPLAATGVTATHALRIGARGSAANQNVLGGIDEVALYRKALSSSQIQDHYNAGIAGTAYAATVQADAPYGWWRLGDAPPAVTYLAEDFGSGQDNGVYFGNITATNGIPGPGDLGADFEGGHVDVDNPSAFDSGGGDLTLEAWIQPNASQGWIIGKDDDNNFLDYLLGFNGSRIRFISQGLFNDVSAGAVTNYTGAWYHIVAVQDAANASIRLYINGTQVTNAPLSIQGITASNPLRIGARGAGANQSVSGVIGHVAFYTNVLSDARIQAHYLAGFYPTNVSIKITGQPQNTAVGATHQAVLSVAATASGTTNALSYQWQKNGVDITGATNADYTLPAAGTNDAGSYTCRVSLPGGLNMLSTAALLKVAAAGPYTQEVNADSPYGWWRLGDAPPPVRVADSGSGNHGGTVAAQTFGGVAAAGNIPSPGGKAAEFQGGHIDVDDPTAFDSGGKALTVEAWVQPEAPVQFNWFVAKEDNNTTLDYLLGCNADGTFRFITQGLANDLSNPNGPSVFDGATWYHVVGVQDPGAAEIRLYVNGDMVGSKPLAATNVTAAHTLRLGDRSPGGGGGGGQTLDGRMGEVAIYMTVLSDSQILAHYNAGVNGSNYAATVQADSPMGWWRLGDAPAANTAADSGSGANNGAYEGSVTTAPGIPGAGTTGACLFQGGHVDISNRSAFDSGGGTLSVEAWFQGTTAGGWIVGKDDSNSALDYLLGFNNGQFWFLSQNLVNNLIGGVPVLDGVTWNHVVAVQNAIENTITLYCNGTNAGSISYAPGSGIVATRRLRIGARGSGVTQSVSGRIDHVAIYTNALASDRVLAHYNAGLSGSSFLATVAADFPLGWWRLGDAPPPPTFSVADSGTGGNSGIGQGSVGLAPGIPGAPDGAGDFQGGFVDIASPAGLTSGGGPLTIEAWVQADSGTGWMVGKDDSNNALDYLLGFNGATFRFFSQTVAQNATSGALLINGKAWHHAVAIQDPANQIARLYADGFQVASMTLTNSGITATNKLRLGARGASSSQSIRARLDEVAIYKGVLGDDRILAHYVAGIYSEPLTLQILKVPEGLQILYSSGVLQSAPRVIGTYTDVTNATSPFVVVPSGPQEYYRLRN